MNKIIGSLVVVSLLVPGVLFAQFETTGITYEEAYPDMDRAFAPMPEPSQAPMAVEKPQPAPFSPELLKNIHEVTMAYREYVSTGFPDIIVPTVVELSLEPTYYERSRSFAVLEISTGLFIPYRYDIHVSTNAVPVFADTNASKGLPAYLLDKENSTFVDYALPESGLGVATITLTSDTPVTSSAISTLLDSNVALPITIEIRAGESNINPLPIIVGKSTMGSQTVKFLETSASIWQITYEYSQPLRITEINLSQSNVVKSTERTLRFLAQPYEAYEVYYNPDRHVKVNTMEAVDLSSDKDVLKLGYRRSDDNFRYTEADVDEDGIPDRFDNCVTVKNRLQEDIDRNGRGDVCDDFDRDGRINSLDNCVNTPNAKQLDTDADGIGDKCDDEESRITEKYVWLPWAGMGLAALVIVIMFISAIRGMKNENKEKELQVPTHDEKEGE